MIAREKIGTWMREPFVEQADGQPRRRAGGASSARSASS